MALIRVVICHFPSDWAPAVSSWAFWPLWLAISSPARWAERWCAAPHVLARPGSRCRGTSANVFLRVGLSQRHVRFRPIMQRNDFHIMILHHIMQFSERSHPEAPTSDGKLDSAASIKHKTLNFMNYEACEIKRHKALSCSLSTDGNFHKSNFADMERSQKQQRWWNAGSWVT